MGPDKVNGGFTGNPKEGNQGSTMYPSIFPPDFAFWKLTPPALGLLGLGIYVGFRKQVRGVQHAAETFSGIGLNA